MTDDEIIAGALTAAMTMGHFPDLAERAPEVCHGEKAVTVLLADQRGGWMVCVHNNGAPRGDWYISDNRAKNSARMAAVDYAHEGL